MNQTGSSPPAPYEACLVCCREIPLLEPVQCTVKNVTQQSALFDLLCQNMNWLPSPRHKFNFHNEFFPFCHDCQSALEKLQHFHQMILQAQTQIDTILANLSGKILLSQNESNPLKLNNKSISSNPNPLDHMPKNNTGINEKIGYYRDLVSKRFSPLIRLTVDPRLFCDIKVVEESMKDRLGVSDTQIPSSSADIQERKYKVETEQTEVGHQQDFERGVRNSRKRKTKEKAQVKGWTKQLSEDEAYAAGSTDEIENEDNFIPYVSSEYEDDEDRQKGSRHNKRIRSGEEQLSPSEMQEEKAGLNLADSLNEESNDRNHSLQNAHTKNNEDFEDEGTAFSGTDIFKNNPYPTLGNRVKELGGGQFILDGNCRFGFSRKENKWKCISCDRTFQDNNSKSRLKQHLRICPGDPSVDVTETFRVNNWIYDLLKNGEFQCRHCKQLFSSSDDVELHLNRCVKAIPPRLETIPCVEVEQNKYLCDNKHPFQLMDDTFKCGTCSTTFVKYSGILEHIRASHMNFKKKRRSTAKSIAPGKFSLDGFLFEKVDNEYRCSKCPYSSPTWRFIQSHIVEKHIEPDKFVCETCGRKFSRKQLLRAHEDIHAKDGPIVCELCGKSLRTERLLQAHKDRKHVEGQDRKFACDICGKCFRTRGYLNGHMKLHQVVICDVCGKDVSRLALKNHLLTHSEVKQFGCSVCGKKFRIPTSLSLHIKIHNGLKPFSCDICGMNFTQRGSVSRHKNSAHKS